jgi:hypothetical protein
VSWPCEDRIASGTFVVKGPWKRFYSPFSCYRRTAVLKNWIITDFLPRVRCRSDWSPSSWSWTTLECPLVLLFPHLMIWRQYNNALRSAIGSCATPAFNERSKVTA